MSRILLEPKRQLQVRITLAFAIVLALQAGVSGYLVLNAMERTLRQRLYSKLLHVGEIGSADPLLATTMAVRSDDPKAQLTVDTMSRSLQQLATVADIRNVYLFRLDEAHFIYLAGTLGPGHPLPTPYITKKAKIDLIQGTATTYGPYRAADGALIVTAYVPIMVSKQLQGVLAIEDLATDLAVMKQLQRQLLLITAIGFIFIVAVSVFVARTIIKPIRQLVDAAEQLGQGRFGVRFPVRSSDEINFLGQTFNDMAEDIQARDAQIRRMNETALTDAHQLYQHILHAMMSDILTADMNNLLTSENPAAEQFLGPRRHEQETMDERLDAHPGLLDIWQRGEAINNQPVVLAGPEGERHVEATLQPLTDHLGEQIGFSLSLVDRTEERRLQQELTMRERLAALGELAAGIAHEIRNPLNGIELMLGLVQEDLSEKGLLDERFTRIHDEVARLNVILTDFLLFARPKPPEPERSNLTELMEDALVLVSADLDEKKIEVTRQFDRLLPDTMLDPAAIRRALVNLLKNACQAMDEHGKLWLTLRGPASTEDGFQIEIRDSGPGISDEVKERLFHPFVTTKGSGTGLGLSIVHKTIASHNGSIHCFNHPAGGACFVVQLPYTEVS